VGAAGTNSEDLYTSAGSAYDRFFTQVIEDAVAYFGSRVLYPSRPSPAEDSPSLSRAAFEKAAQIAIRDVEKFETTARDCGYRLGSAIYDAYIAGRVKPRGLRRLFLAHIDEPGLARKVCTAVIARVRPRSRTARD